MFCFFYFYLLIYSFFFENLSTVQRIRKAKIDKSADENAEKSKIDFFYIFFSSFFILLFYIYTYNTYYNNSVLPVHNASDTVPMSKKCPLDIADCDCPFVSNLKFQVHNQSITNFHRDVPNSFCWIKTNICNTRPPNRIRMWKTVGYRYALFSVLISESQQQPMKKLG